ncbi:MAG: 5-carboxymethyl-2-hydroxymuconate Delta-isomerase [Vicinamibacterales bacterium]
MPHLIIEYSSNLRPVLDVSRLVQRLHEAAIRTGIFPLGGVRTRAVAREHYRVADGHPDNAFVHAVLRVGSGRDLETRQRVGQQVFADLCGALATISDTQPLAISFEVEEIEPMLSYRKNNIHEYLTRRSAPPSPPTPEVSS